MLYGCQMMIFKKKDFDAIIIDEGQDFDPDFWDPLMDLLKDENESFLYIFFDFKSNDISKKCEVSHKR